MITKIAILSDHEIIIVLKFVCFVVVVVVVVVEKLNFKAFRIKLFVSFSYNFMNSRKNSGALIFLRKSVGEYFFSFWVFFHGHLRFTGQQGKGRVSV